MFCCKGTLGEVRREGALHRRTARTGDRLAQESGRLYTATCSADLGDTRCRLDLTYSAFPRHRRRRLARRQPASPRRARRLRRRLVYGGKLAFTSGANGGLSVEVKNHRKAGAVTLDCGRRWRSRSRQATLRRTAGCDKRFDTCHDRFNNVVNFRGFPHIPGNDFVMRYPLPGEPGNDGASRQS